MNPGPAFLWLADYLVVASALLTSACTAGMIVRQPVRRLTVAWAAAVALAALASTYAVPGWPRLSIASTTGRLIDFPWEVPPSTPSPYPDGDSFIQMDKSLPNEARSGTATAGGRGSSGQSPGEAGRGTRHPSEVRDAPAWAWWRHLVLYGFSAGCVFALSRLALGAVQIARLRRASADAPGFCHAALRRTVGGGRMPRLRVSARLDQPVVLGIFRPTIVLPERLTRIASEGQIASVLRHEWAHICHRDLWLLTLLRCLGVVLFPHPLYWWLRSRVRRDQEVLADAAAARAVGKLEYATALVQWARLAHERCPVPTALALGERPSQLKRRIAMLLNPSFDVEPRCPASCRWAAWTLAALGVAALSVLTLQPAAPVSAGETAEPAAKTPPEAPAVESPPSPFSSRSGKVKENLIRGNGNKESEAAVAAGLKWLAQHQAPDGHWSLDGFDKDGHCNCSGGAAKGDDIAATAFGLLPLLGAGETHKSDGKYAKQVERALKYLLGRQKKDGGFTDFMYSHGLATTAVCEAYGMTADPILKAPAQKALDFIVSAQEDKGGWGYIPRQRSDTSVTGFQVTALKSGQMAGLNVPVKTLQGVSKWLDSVATADGSSYGYVGQPGTLTMTAVGLLCRQYLGWGPRNPGLKAGVANLQKVGPDPYINNTYYYYYATQVLRHSGGEAWEMWNPKMRDALIARQDKGDDPKHAHQKGSWSPDVDLWATAGGRLMITSLSILTLEVYYRQLPLYRREGK